MQAVKTGVVKGVYRGPAGQVQQVCDFPLDAKQEPTRPQVPPSNHGLSPDSIAFQNSQVRDS